MMKCKIEAAGEELQSGMHNTIQQAVGL